MFELHPTPDQELFRATAARFLADTCPLAEVRRVAAEPAGFEPTWWLAAADLGWTSMLAPGVMGGSVSDNPLLDLALVAYERGRVVSPGPFVPVNAAMAVLAMWPDRTAECEELITGAMAGTSVVTIAVDEPGRPHSTVGFGTTVSRSAGGHVVTGAKAPVEAAMGASAFIVAATIDDEPAWVLVDAQADGLTVTPRESVDLVRRFGSIRLEDTPAVAMTRGELALQRGLDVAMVLQLAETVGAIDRVLEFTVEWAFDRHSFGRPLASYQALKHRFADMRTWLEACQATTLSAARAVGTATDDASLLTSAAQACVGQFAPEIVQDCVQIHGGLGITWEHDLHLYLRRVMLNSATFGTVAEHRRRLGRAVLKGR
ncbi:MAG: acyl-CoA dehydrogenase family protein [Acidimicrobiia bacterium]